MSNYTKTTDFEAKDSLPSGDNDKIIKGAEFETEFDAISTAIATKADTAGPTFTGTATFATTNATTVQIGGVAITSTAAELNTLDGITSTTAELNKLDGFTGTVDDLNYAKDLRASGVTAAEFDILDGLTATATELNILDGATVTTAELNLLDGVTATTAELNYVDGVTSSIQTQIDTKSPTASPTFTGTVTIPTVDINAGTIDGTDVTVGTGKTLDVSGGTLTLADDQISGDKVEGGTIASTTITSLASTTVDTTNVEVTNIKAKDGTSAGSIADTTGVVTLASSVLTTTDINGGTIDGATIGGTTAAAGSFTTVSATGNITVGGTVDGRDVATDGTKLDGIEAGADVTDTTNVTAAGAVMDSELTSEASVKALDQGVATTDSPTFAGLTTTANVSFGDNDKAVFGAGSDLQIYHDGSNSYIDDAGSGRLNIRASDLRVEKYTGETIAKFIADGAVELNYNDVKKLATTSTGIDVTGTVTADGLEVEAAAPVLEIDSTTAASLATIQFTTAGTVDSKITHQASTGTMTIDSGRSASWGGEIDFVTDTDTRMRIADNGDISFYEDTGTTAKFFWDASAERLGIGTSSPSSALHVKGSGHTAITITGGTANDAQINFGDTGDEDIGAIHYDNASNAMKLLTNAAEAMRIDSSGNVGIGRTSASQKLDVNGIIVSDNATNGFRATEGFSSSYYSQFSSDLNSGSTSVDTLIDSVAGTGWSAQILFRTQQAGGSIGERARIDSSGNLLVGTTTTSRTTAGHELHASGFARHTANNDKALEIVRTTGNGEMVEFFKDSTLVGSIGSEGGDSLFIGSGDAGVKFAGGSNAIIPVGNASNLQSTRDAAIDIGSTGGRYKDLYLSGGAYLGGTGSANHLDDYEEGTWTPTMSSGTATAGTSRYTKVGRLVTVYSSFTNFSDTTSSTTFAIGGLPFAAESSDRAVVTGTLAQHISTIGSITGGYLASTTSVYLYNTSTSGFVNLVHSNLSSSSSLYVAFTYFAA